MCGSLIVMHASYVSELKLLKSFDVKIVSRSYHANSPGRCKDSLRFHSYVA